mgnify:CR=1 FL=1
MGLLRDLPGVHYLLLSLPSVDAPLFAVCTARGTGMVRELLVRGEASWATLDPCRYQALPILAKRLQKVIVSGRERVFRTMRICAGPNVQQPLNRA